MRKRVQLLVVLAAFAIPNSGFSCEPILPLAQLLGGSSFAGPMMLTKSLVWLFVAVAIKCFAFVFLERRLSWPKAILFMLVANVLSTIPASLLQLLPAPWAASLCPCQLFGFWERWSGIG